jgi:hypothetical protein
MSTAEITAYLAGFELAAEAAHHLESGAPLPDVDERPMAGELLGAKARLGDVRFSYWVLRGCREALGL